ncbi:hypothetical protein CHI08_11955 [Peribacillus simplex]|nr:hypothetical protein CHI08_11955 [Peribacillus simplex]
MRKFRGMGLLGIFKGGPIFNSVFIWAEQESKKAKDRQMELKEKNYGVRFGRSKYDSIMTHLSI